MVARLWLPGLEDYEMENSISVGLFDEVMLV
jgi:hypothetical protein